MTTEEKYLDRPAASEYVRSKGLPCSKTTLAKLVTVGGGPALRKFGNRAVYLAADLDAWINSKLSAPLHSSTAA